MLLPKAVSLLKNATAPVKGDSAPLNGPQSSRTYQATLNGTGTLAAVVVIEVSNEDTDSKYMTLGTITLSDTGTPTDGFADDAAWIFTRARLASISGTGASVDVNMAY